MRSMKLMNIVEFSFTSVVLLFKDKKILVENLTWFREQDECILRHDEINQQNERYIF